MPSGSTRAASSTRRSAISFGTSREGLDAPGLDLDLGGDQLAGERGLEGRAGRSGLHFLEPVDEVERDRIEQRELLFHGNCEVGARVEPLARVSKKLVSWNALLVAHGA